MARETAVNNLIDTLRTMPSPPLRVDTDAQVRKHNGRLRELVETAYSLRPRPAGDLLQSMGTFCGTTSTISAA